MTLTMPTSSISFETRSPTVSLANVNLHNDSVVGDEKRWVRRRREAARWGDAISLEKNSAERILAPIAIFPGLNQTQRCTQTTRHGDHCCRGTHMRKEQNPAHPRTATTNMRLATNWLPPHLQRFPPQSAYFERERKTVN